MLPGESASMPPERLAEIVRAAEAAGYETAWLPDHLLPPEPFGTTYGGVYEPLITAGWLAAQTSRIRLGTSVLILPLRSPYAVAKQAATLHRLSGERLTLGIGTGWDQTEFALTGSDYRRRGRTTDEGLAVIRALLSGEHDGGVFEPRPRRPLPLMVGGTSERALRRAARYADEWQAVGLGVPAFATAASRLRELAGRPIRTGTRLEWTGDDLAGVVRTAREAAAAGADAVAVWFGPEDGTEERLQRFAAAMPKA